MPSPIPGPKRERLVSEAADIFLRLREDPQNAEYLAERDAFVNRGSDEREVYEKMARAWSAAQQRKPPNRASSLAVLAFGLALAGGLYFGIPELRILYLADFSTAREPAALTLASGDALTLDADTSIVDETEIGDRDVQLLEGAAYFVPSHGGRPFTVQAGPVAVRTLGTEFEVAKLEEQTIVAVFEGSVEVSVRGQSWVLKPGGQLIWSDTAGAVVQDIAPASIATWRDDRLVSDGMTFTQIAAVIDRRLPGRVVVMDDALARSNVTGSFDLSEPETALDILVGAQGAYLISARPMMTLIRR